MTPYQHFKFKTNDKTFAHIVSEYKQRTGIKTNSRAIVELVKLSNRFRMINDEYLTKISELEDKLNDIQHLKESAKEYYKLINSVLEDD